MKRLLVTAIITVLTGVALASGAVAQNTGPPANPNASTPAVANPNANNPGAPATGANSFTEGQAKSRIEAAGYSKPIMHNQNVNAVRSAIREVLQSMSRSYPRA
jgi:hypothetical protein